MTKIYLGLGTNLGDREKNLRDAVQEIEKRIGKVISLSAFYETAPWGFVSENTFLNAAMCVETVLTPREVLQATQQIEYKIGRTVKSVGRIYTDRLIDIDILLYDNLILQEEGLILPHPSLHERRFVTEPLAEIAPKIIHPILNKTIQELNDAIPTILKTILKD